MSLPWKLKAKKMLVERMPILGWIRNYTREDAVSDIIAGITISLTIIPQSIAYAALAKLSPKDGLNSAFMGCFIYVFFGTIKEVVIGPTSLMALLTIEYTHHLHHNIDFVVLLCFLSGIVELIMALLRLGFLVDYISTPVVSGFTTATAIIILVSQIKGIMGVRFKAKSFIENFECLFDKASTYRSADLILGLTCIVVLLVMRSVKDIKLSKNTNGKHVIEKIFWFLSISRNALVVISTSLITYWYEHSDNAVPFLTTDAVKGGLPSFKFPATSTMSSTIYNETYTRNYTTKEMISELGTGIIVVPVVAVLANVAIAKAYADGGVKGNQEMLTLALCNIFGSFVQSMPTTGAFTRSAVISASGVRTPLAGLYSAGITLLALQFLADYFHLIPRATLSAILIAAVLFLVDYKIILPLFRSSKRDFGTLVGTLVLCLVFGVETGLILGAAAGIIHLVYLWSKPPFNKKFAKFEKKKCLVIAPKLGLYYPSVELISKTLLELAEQNGRMPIILDCTNFVGLDYTSVKSLHSISKSMFKNGVDLIFLNAPNKLIQIWKHSDCGNIETCTMNQLEFDGFTIGNGVIDQHKNKSHAEENGEVEQEMINLLINEESKC